MAMDKRDKFVKGMKAELWKNPQSILKWIQISSEKLFNETQDMTALAAQGRYNGKGKVEGKEGNSEIRGY